LSRAQLTVTQADSLLDDLLYNNIMEPLKARDLCDSLINFYTSSGRPCASIQVMAHKAGLYAITSDFIAAQQELLRAFRNLDRVDCDEYTDILLQYDQSYIWACMGDLQKADSLTWLAIHAYCPEWPDKRLLLKLYLNLQFSNSSLPEIVATLDSAYTLTITHHLPFFEMRVLNNLGTYYANHDSLSAAKHYFLRALALARQQKDDANLMTLFNNLAGLSDNNREIRSYVDSAIVYAARLHNFDLLEALNQNKAYFLHQLGNFKEAYDALWFAFDLKDTILNLDKLKAIADMREKYETEKRINEIQSLKLDNLDAELTSLKYKRTKNRFLWGGLFLMGLAVLLGYGLVSIRKSRAIIAMEKERSESLLLNILPEEIADELKAKGQAEPRQFEQVSILFSDFKNFTDQSSFLSPAELVEELNVCFGAFDQIMDQYQLEKIKTIGDAYMAACGLPVPMEDSVHKTIRAALDMQEFMLSRKLEHKASRHITFDMRIGIHTGPVVAGIVGKKKFQYDIWGDTVNTASRMETNGEIGQVNISQETYLLVRNDPAFEFIRRGIIEIKGKGAQQMWFVRLA
jgi:class 3 adenylate cyclase